MNVDVSQIVREVVAEMERRQRAAAAAPNNSAPPTRATATAVASPAPSGADPRELVLCSRVVSLGQIADRLGRIRRLVVPPGAVVTPAARDALADRGIALVFASAAAPTADAAARLVLVAARTTYSPIALGAALRAEGIEAESQTSDCLVRTIDSLAGRVRDGATLGVVLTPDVAAAVCLANRLQGIRAISASDPAVVVEAARAVGANVLAIDPRGRGMFQLKQTIVAFCRGGLWACPEVLRPRLG